jgi:hypothetical protein
MDVQPARGGALFSDDPAQPLVEMVKGRGIDLCPAQRRVVWS